MSLFKFELNDTLGDYLIMAYGRFTFVPKFPISHIVFKLSFSFVLKIHDLMTSFIFMLTSVFFFSPWTEGLILKIKVGLLFFLVEEEEK